jgi:membrane protease subunit (stomatin/prohibitin family)
MSWVSYGEKITITLTPLAATTILVQIHSECGMPTQVIDWGKNRSVVTNIYNQLMSSLASTTGAYSAQPTPQQAPQAAPQPTYQPAPQTAQAGGFKFCFKCGTKLSQDAMFCHSCGQKQQ